MSIDALIPSRIARRRARSAGFASGSGNSSTSDTPSRVRPGIVARNAALQWSTTRPAPQSRATAGPVPGGTPKCIAHDLPGRPVGIGTGTLRRLNRRCPAAPEQSRMPATRDISPVTERAPIVLPSQDRRHYGIDITEP